MFEFRNNKEQAKTPLSATTTTLIEPKQIEIDGAKFIISKMPATVAQEVIFKLPTGLLPLINQFSQSEQMIFKMLSYCERVYDGAQNVPLISKEIIDNHVNSFNTLIKLEQECLAYNYDFFAQGKLLVFLNKGLSLVESRASKILTDLLDKLLQQDMQHTGN